MFLGPIVTLELITSARRLRYFILRGLYGVILLFVLWTSYQESGLLRGENTIQAAASFSNSFFEAFAFVQLIAVLILTPAMTAGSIAQERERRTIEYLLASSLTSGEIVLSKYLARTSHVASLLIVALPMLAAAMLLGGIDFRKLIAAFVIALSTLLATAALSIAASVWAKRGRDAVVRTYVFLFAFLTIPPILWGLGGTWWYWLDWLSLVGQFLTQVNPVYALAEAVSSFSFSATPGYPWAPVVIFAAAHAAFTVIMLGWATLSLRRVYRKSIGASPAVQKRRFFRFLRPRPGDWPMLWKELFAETAAVNVGRLGKALVVLLFGISLVPPFIILFVDQPPGFEVLHGYVGGMSTVLECAALLGIAARAAGSISAEKERDSWATLISTPLTPAEIVWAKIAGSIYSVRWFALPLAILWAIMLLVEPSLVVLLPVLVGVFACVALAIAALGTWFSCWCRTTIRAMSATIGVGMFIGGGGYLLCCLPLAIGGSESMIFFAAWIPFLLGGPHIAWHALSEAGADGVAALVAWLCGTGGYALAGVLLTSLTIGSFDDMVGRPRRMNPPLPREPRPPGNAASDAPIPG